MPMVSAESQRQTFCATGEPSEGRRYCQTTRRCDSLGKQSHPDPELGASRSQRASKRRNRTRHPPSKKRTRRASWRRAGPTSPAPLPPKGSSAESRRRPPLPLPCNLLVCWHKTSPVPRYHVRSPTQGGL